MVQVDTPCLICKLPATHNSGFCSELEYIEVDICDRLIYVGCLVDDRFWAHILHKIWSEASSSDFYSPILAELSRRIII